MASLDGGHASPSIASPLSLGPHELPAKDYQDEDETHDSKLKALWDDEMGDLEGQYKPYTKVCVLLLSWDQKIDDLKTDKESKVAALESLFKNKFKFETKRKTLRGDPIKSTQNQLNMYLSTFVYENDNKDTLLIIYYAGHGFLDYEPVKLMLTPSIKLPKKSTRDPHEVIWTSAENLIQQTCADVLVIFDCCNAGALDCSNRASQNNRTFEYLAATSANSTTKAPGPNSFTSALIWSLDQLLEERNCFSTSALLQTILNRAPDFPEDQSPRLSERPDSAQRKILIAPTTSEPNKKVDEAIQPDTGDKSEEEQRQDLLLRFVFNCDITIPLIKEMAIHIKHLIQQKEIKAKTVSWEGINMATSKDTMIAYRAIHRFSDVLKRKRTRSELTTAKGLPILKTSEATLAPGVVQESVEFDSPSADEMQIATPKPPKLVEFEVGEDQGAPVEKTSPRDGAGGGYDILQPPNLLAVPDAPKRKRGNDEGSDHGSVAATSKRGKIGK
ncbi:homeobox domain-containing protein [Apiospora arundinis]